MAHNTLNLTGQRFGQLTVIGRADGENRKRSYWRCQCDCGTECVKLGKYLTIGHTKSCGCAQRAYRAKGNQKYGGIAKTTHKREYTIWRSMKSRCTTPSSSNFKFYGGRGVTICDRWRDDFSAFMADMGRCPEGQTLDRIDPNGHYTPENCRWATWETQHRNTRRTVHVGWRGKTVSAAEAFTDMGLTYNQRLDSYRLLRSGMTIDDVARHHAATLLSI